MVKSSAVPVNFQSWEGRLALTALVRTVFRLPWSSGTA